MSTPPGAESQSNTHTIARNSFWYGLEMAFSFLLAMATSVAMARAIGPEKLGYFNFIGFLASMSGQIGGLGIPVTTRKYMAEFLGAGNFGTARAVYAATLRQQTRSAAVIAGVGVAAVLLLVPAEHRVYSAFLVASLFPGMILGVPSQANMAAENLRANVWGTFVGGALYGISVGLSLYLHLGVLGISVGFLFYRSVELTVRLLQVGAWVRKLPEGEVPAELRQRMKTFSGATTILLILNIVVWDRSDALFLKWFCTDLKQITFYFVAFNLPERIGVIPQVFVSAFGATFMAHYGRNQEQAKQMASSAVRYVALVTFPLLTGMAVLSGAIVRLLYGAQYLPAIPVLAVAAVAAMPRTFLLTGQQLLQASEKQKFMVIWSCIAAGANVLLDVTLIPRYQALGGAVANGAAQALSVLGIWAVAVYLLRLRLPYLSLARIAFSALTMGAAAWLVARPLPPWAAAALAPPVGAAVYLVMLRLTGSLGESDRERLSKLRDGVPAVFRRSIDRVLDLVAPPAPASRATAC